MHMTGTFLFYSRAVSVTMLTELIALISYQYSPTKKTMKTFYKFLLFLHYAASNQCAVLTYLGIKMVLAIHSNASYLNEPKPRSLVGVHIFISLETNFPDNIWAVLNIFQSIKAVISSSAES